MTVRAASGREPVFGHPARVLKYWRTLAGQALRQGAPTPFYLFAAQPVAEALDQLAAVAKPLPVPVRHWLSCKTQPLPALLSWWRRQGRGIEVVSEFELLAALKTGFAAEDILLNGPAKHRWLLRHPLPGLRVNFDSDAEIKVLLPLAKRLHWSVGVRCLTDEEFDPECPQHPTQFGFEPPAAVAALRRLRQARVRLETVHFHLRTNVATPAVYERAVVGVAAICREAGVAPRYLDVGGGLPPPWVLDREGRRVDRGFSLAALGASYTRILQALPSVEELWLENGRFISARSGVLVTRILDVKERRGLRQWICDGGRTTNALVSQWEQHALLTLPQRGGPRVRTAVCGPTCMAFDRLACRSLPRAVRPGDHLLWLEAGAYHLPWETRFSHGHAAVLWHEDNELRTVRAAQSFADWWSQWR